MVGVVRSVREVRSQTEYKWFFCSWSRCGLKNVTLRDIPSFPFISCPFVNKCRWVWSYCPMLYKRCTWKKVHLYKRFYLFVHEQEHADQLWTRVKNPERMKIIKMWVHMFFMKSLNWLDLMSPDVFLFSVKQSRRLPAPNHFSLCF